MRIVGIDVGSRTVKRVVLEDGRVVDRAVLPTTHDPLAVCAQLLPDRGWDRMVATGYGRGLVHSRWGAETLTEIRAVAIGARVLFPTAEVVLDVGGQDTKVIRIRRDGSVRKFEMNDRCAAGTGRFLEVMATALCYGLEEFVEAALEASHAESIHAMCAVFAESEVISATARGADRAALARGVHEAVVRRTLAMLARIGPAQELVFCGGGARNRCLRSLLEREVRGRVRVPDEPQTVAALGAAAWGWRQAAGLALG